MTDPIAVANPDSRVEDFRQGRRHHRSAGSWLVLLLVAITALIIAAPLILVTINAFKSADQYLEAGPLSLPSPPTLSNITTYVAQVDFGQKLLNSIIVSTAVALGASLLSLLSAYAIGVGRIRGRAGITALFLLVIIIPQESLIYPLFSGVQYLGPVQSTVLPLIAILTALYAAFGTYLIASVLGEFPRALLDAAEIDGAGRWRTLWSVVFPVVRPTVTVLFVMFFIWSWNEFLIPFILLSSGDVQTVPIALASLQGDRFQDPSLTAAGALVSLLPTLVFFLFFQRTLVKGVAAGAIK